MKPLQKQVCPSRWPRLQVRIIVALSVVAVLASAALCLLVLAESYDGDGRLRSTLGVEETSREGTNSGSGRMRDCAAYPIQQVCEQHMSLLSALAGADNSCSIRNIAGDCTVQCPPGSRHNKSAFWGHIDDVSDELQTYCGHDGMVAFAPLRYAFEAGLHTDGKMWIRTRGRFDHEDNVPVLPLPPSQTLETAAPCASAGSCQSLPDLMADLEADQHCEEPDFQQWRQVLFDWSGSCHSVSQGRACMVQCQMETHGYSEYWEDVDKFTARVRGEYDYEALRSRHGGPGAEARSWTFREQRGEIDQRRIFQPSATVSGRYPGDGRREFTLVYRFTY